MKKLSTILFFILFTLINNYTYCLDNKWREKIDKSLLNNAKNVKFEFIVVLNSQTDVKKAKSFSTKEEKGNYVYSQLKLNAQTTQVNLINYLDNNNVIYKGYYLVNCIWVYGNMIDLENLAKYTEVEEITSNPHITFNRPTSEKESYSNNNKKSAEWGITTTKADQVWSLGYKGQGVVIGGQDTGYDWEHPTLKSKYRGWNGTVADHNYNWHDAISSGNGGVCGLNSPIPCDDDQHGTHTMGTMVGDDGGANQIGMAPDAKWIGCRNMDEGNGTPATYIECFEWFLAPTDLNNLNPDPSKAPHVINNSWGCPLSEGCNTSIFSIMEIAVNNLKLAGVVVVVSAGNSGPSCGSIDDPSAIFENSFTVGATNNIDEIAGFSSRGTVTIDGSNRLKPDISAPGVGIRSCIPGGGYNTFSGTSMAGPHVAGMVALLISAYPGLAGNVDSIETIIENTAIQLTSTQDCGGYLGSNIPNTTYGHGRIDVLAAINNVALNDGDFSSEEMGLIIYPNPTPNYFNINLKGFKNNRISMKIVDVLGGLAYSDSFNLSNNNFSYAFTEKLVSGVYFIQIISDSKSYTQKLVVN